MKIKLKYGNNKHITNEVSKIIYKIDPIYTCFTRDNLNGLIDLLESLNLIIEEEVKEFKDYIDKYFIIFKL